MRGIAAIIAVVVIVVVVVVVTVIVIIAGIITVTPRIRIAPIIRPGAGCSMGMRIAGRGGTDGVGGSVGDDCAAHVGMEIRFRRGLLRIGVGVQG